LILSKNQTFELKNQQKKSQQEIVSTHALASKTATNYKNNQIILIVQIL